MHNRDSSGVINVFGPQNRERYNTSTVKRVARALESGGHTVRIIDGNMRVVERLLDFMPQVIAGERPGKVFNMAFGIQGVSRYTHLPAMLEMLGLRYVGSGPQAHRMALDKVIAKIMFQAAGLPMAGFWNFASPQDQFEDLVCTPEHPLIVKPKMEAVSFGIRIVDNENDLRDAVSTIVNEFGQHVLVEEFIAGRELAIGLLGNGAPEVLPIVEIDLEGDPNAIQTDSDKLSATPSCWRLSNESQRTSAIERHQAIDGRPPTSVSPPRARPESTGWDQSAARRASTTSTSCGIRWSIGRRCSP